MTFTIVLVLMSIVSNSAWADSKKLTITLEKPAESLDPAKALSVEAQFIASQVYENLFLTGYDGTILPGLATHWETSSDRRTLTIQLDPDSKFSNGVPVTARHVRNMIEDTVRTGSFRGLDRILGVQPFKQKATQHIAGVQVLGEFQLKIQLEKPYSRFLQEFSDQKCVVTLADGKSLVPLGSGPFKIDSFNISGSKVKLLKNSFWNRAPAPFEEIEIDTELKPMTDISFVNPKDTNGNLVPFEFFETEVYFLGFNSDSPLLSKRETRLALGSLIDEGLINQTTWSAPYSVNSFLPVGTLGYSPKDDVSFQNIGYPKKELMKLRGKPLSIYTYHPKMIKIAVAYCNKLKALGIKCNIKKTDFSEISAAKKGNKLDLFFARFKPTMSSSEDLLSVFAVGNPVNIFTGGSKGTVLTKDLDQAFIAIQEVDVENRSSLDRAYQKLDYFVRNQGLVRPIRYGAQKQIWRSKNIKLPFLGIQGPYSMHLNEVIKE